jgi:hypothetical protein
MFTKNEIYTLAEVIIADPMWVDLFFRSYAIQGFATFDVIQAKKKITATNAPLINSSL